jgi:hypothetical protein
MFLLPSDVAGCYLHYCSSRASACSKSLADLGDKNFGITTDARGSAARIVLKRDMNGTNEGGDIVIESTRILVLTGLLFAVSYGCSAADTVDSDEAAVTAEAIGTDTWADGTGGTGGTSVSAGGQSAGGVSWFSSSFGRRKVCTPGVTQKCLGPGRCEGAQACRADGEGWEQCDCGTSGTTPKSGGAGGTTPASSSAI